MDDHVILSLSGISKRYDDVQALDGVDLELGPGISGLVGPNGAGKSTLMKILIGLLHADTGSGKVLGHDIRSESLEIRRMTGVLHEWPVYPTMMSPLRYLRHIKGLYSSSTDPHELLTLVDLSSAEERKIGTLSRGMLQRLGIAQALVGSPKLVLLDEPTANIDVEGRESILDLLLTIHDERGVSFLISSHILSELEKVCHNVAFIQKGKIVEVGRVQDIVSEHTASTYRVITSHPKMILNYISSHPLVSSAVVSGASSLTIRTDPTTIETVRKDIGEIAEELGVTLYTISKSDDLQEAYKEIMGNERQSP